MVSLILPHKLARGELKSVFGAMGLDARRGSDPDEWLLRDKVMRRPLTGPALVEAKTLAAPWLGHDKFDLIDLPPHMSTLTASDIAEECLKVTERNPANSLLVTLYGLQLDILAANDADLVDAARNCHATLTGLSFDGGATLEFPKATAHVISLHEQLYLRARLPSIMLRFEQDPTLIDDWSAGKIKLNGILFGSGAGLAGPGFFDGTYLGPLLASRAPDVWAIHCQRSMGTIVFTLGSAIRGVDPVPAEPLQLWPRQTRTAWPESIIPKSEKAWGETVEWWAMKLNQMFAYLTDPTLYRDAHGQYLPSHHLNWMMNGEELFKRVTSVLSSWRDQYAARVLSYSALDLVGEAFLGPKMHELCDPGFAEKTLVEIRKRMPIPVQEVLLPHAEAAVDALPKVAEGFFIRTAHGTATVDVIAADGTVDHMTLNSAIKEAMRGYRNATHGFGGRSKETKMTRLLAQHNGSLPPELVNLPYMYLLAVLSDPERIRRRIVGQCSAVNRT